jgi:hypothetical protein
MNAKQMFHNFRNFRPGSAAKRSEIKTLCFQFHDNHSGTVVYEALVRMLRGESPRQCSFADIWSWIDDNRDQFGIPSTYAIPTADCYKLIGLLLEYFRPLHSLPQADKLTTWVGLPGFPTDRTTPRDMLRMIEGFPIFASSHEKPAMKHITVEQVTYVTLPNGYRQDINTLTDDQIIEAIEASEAEIKRLEAIDNKPDIVTTQLAKLQEGISALVTLSNTRTPKP